MKLSIGLALAATALLCGCGGGSSTDQTVITEPLGTVITGTYSEANVGTGTVSGGTDRFTHNDTVTDDATHTAHSVGFYSTGWTAGKVQTFTVIPWIDAPDADGPVTRQRNRHFTGTLFRHNPDGVALADPIAIDLTVKR